MIKNFKNFGKHTALSTVQRPYNESYGLEWKELSKKCKENAGFLCQECGNGPKPDVPLQAHHIVPLADGGINALFNLICLCDKCHQGMHPDHEINKGLKKKGKRKITIKLRPPK